MAQPVMQKSFNSGEWAPQLLGRVDIEKYHSGAALLRNFFVDYRGGASTRPGTQYSLQCLAAGARLIPFQITVDIGFICEFGDQYVRFFNNGSPVLESGNSITAITTGVTTDITAANAYAEGDWVFISGVVGTTQLNGNYYIVHNPNATHFHILNLDGTAVDSSAFGAYISGGTTQRVYTIQSPFAAVDLPRLKFAGYLNQLVLCHPDYPPSVLIYNAETDWSLTSIVFGSQAQAPGALTPSTTLGAGTWSYAYVVTSVDINGQESLPSPIGLINNKTDIKVSPGGTNTVSWAAVPGAVSYNVYAAVPIDGSTPIPVGSQYGFIGNVTGNTFNDSNIAPDFSLGPPIARNPFAPGAGVASVTITAGGNYTAAPGVTFGAAPAGGITATGYPILGAKVVAVNSGGFGYTVGTKIVFDGGLRIEVTSIDGGTGVNTVKILYPGSYIDPLPTNPQAGHRIGGSGIGALFDITYTVTSIALTNSGAGYSTAPAVTFSAGIAAATAVLGDSTSGFPSVPAFFQQRLVLAGQASAPQTMYMSQTGAFYNFNVSNPIQDTDAITATLVSGMLNNIKSMIAQPSGLLVLTDGASWLVNGGGFGTAVTPSSIVALPQSFNGTNDMPPIVSNFDVLYPQSKGSSIRDSTYNFYANVFTGTDISIMSSHLFFNKPLKEWCWAEEPYRIAWVVREDGMLLSLTFMKEQEFIAWAHSDTGNGDLFKSTATIIENLSQGYVNSVYFIVERTINGATVQYVERLNSRYMPGGYTDAWAIDAGVQYTGAPTTAFQGAQHLAGRTVTGLANGAVIAPFSMPINGQFTLPAPASKVTIGLAFTAQLQTLPIDIGEPTIQGKQKKINAVTIRVAETLGIKIGSTLGSVVPMKDFVLGNVGSQSNTIVTGLVDGDGRTFVDPLWSEQGQFAIQQDQPYPATILGVIPQLAIGDTKGLQQ